MEESFLIAMPFGDRSLSNKDIRVIVECGCPSTDRKVVNSGKRLRAYLGLDEGKVCASFHLPLFVDSPL